MQRTEKEKCAFLEFCGKRDRDFLLGNKKMCLGEFDRLTYIVDFLGFRYYHIAIWNEFGEQFLQQFAFLQRLTEEMGDMEYCDDIDEEIHLHDRWLMDFVKDIPDPETRNRCKRLVKKSYIKKGYEYPEKMALL